MAANHVVIRVPSSCPPQEKQISCGGPVNSLAPIRPLERFSGGQQQSTSIQHVVSICTDLVTAPGVQVKMMNMIELILKMSTRVWALLPVQPTSDTGNTYITIMMMIHHSGRMLTSRPNVDSVNIYCSNVYIFIYF